MSVTRVANFCVQCGAASKAGDKFCQRCGVPIEMASGLSDDGQLFCKTCHKEVLLDAGFEKCFCHHCQKTVYPVSWNDILSIRQECESSGAVKSTNSTKDDDVPQEIKHFSWPAVLMCLPWMFAQKIYFWAWLATALMVVQWCTPEGGDVHLVVVVANLAVWGYMWFNGNAIAWRCRKYHDATHFLLVERKWKRASITVLICAMVLALLFGRVFTMYTGGRAKMESLGPMPTVIKHTER
ncbi:zinc ribbon domain-containing protein [Patescibacteria group bacterium]|nr:zinc ribbon domain-containing protein [Patescibacteria group bacterium]